MMTRGNILLQLLCVLLSLQLCLATISLEDDSLLPCSVIAKAQLVTSNNNRNNINNINNNNNNNNINNNNNNYEKNISYAYYYSYDRVGVKGKDYNNDQLQNNANNANDKIAKNKINKDRKRRRKVQLWPRNKRGLVKIGYYFSDDQNEKSVRLAISEWQQHTCLLFKEWGRTPRRRSSYIDFGRHSKRRAAHVGYRRKKPSKVDTTGDAVTIRSMIQKIGNALGFRNTQQRSDRDEYVYIHKENIKQRYRGQKIYKQFYTKKDTNNYGVPYDYTSIMHFPEMKHQNSAGFRVMVAKDARFQFIMGKGDKMSFMDKKLFNTAYRCTEYQLQSCRIRNPCSNEGFLGSSCHCVCPDGTFGGFCQNRCMGYNEALLYTKSPHSRIYTEPSKISSPFFPTPGNKGLFQSIILQAPKCHKAVFTLNHFQIYQPRNCEPEFLEIMVDPITAIGIRVYGSSKSPNWSPRKYVSLGSTLVLHFQILDWDKYGMRNPYMGFRGAFTIEGDFIC